MAIELFNNGHHKCLMFSDLADGIDNNAIQANQFMIIDNGHGALIDPGGNMTYTSLLMEMHNHFPPKKLEYILASNADPDIIASVNKWLLHSDCKIAISKLWYHYLPHFCSMHDNMGERTISIPDEGMVLKLGDCIIKAVPAHFIHSEGNFQFYDPVSKILFSGDLGASVVEQETIDTPVVDFNAHIPYMEGFHRRYMISNKVLRFWANMVRRHEVEWIVPQHGRPFRGKKMVNEFLSWIENLECGVDNMTQEHYSMP